MNHASFRIQYAVLLGAIALQTSCSGDNQVLGEQSVAGGNGTGGAAGSVGTGDNTSGATSFTASGGAAAGAGGATLPATGGSKATGGTSAVTGSTQATGGVAVTGGSKATGGTSSSSSGGTSTRQCPVPTPTPNSNCTLDMSGVTCNLGNIACEICQCSGLNPGDVLACVWLTAGCADAGVGGQSSVGGGGTTSGGGAGTSVTCSALNCPSTQICVAVRTEGGAVVQPDANGNCPTGRHLESNQCANDYGYECRDLTGCSASAVSCSCGAPMCPANHSCSNPVASTWLDPAASLVCQLLAP